MMAIIHHPNELCVVHSIHILPWIWWWLQWQWQRCGIRAHYIWTHITNTYKSTTQQLIRKPLVFCLGISLYSLSHCCVVEHYFISTCVQWIKEYKCTLQPNRAADHSVSFFFIFKFKENRHPFDSQLKFNCYKCESARFFPSLHFLLCFDSFVNSQSNKWNSFFCDWNVNLSNAEKIDWMNLSSSLSNKHDKVDNLLVKMITNQWSPVGHIKKFDVCG